MFVTTSHFEQRRANELQRYHSLQVNTLLRDYFYFSHASFFEQVESVQLTQKRHLQGRNRAVLW
jgi:hypothetical protein